MAEFDNRRVRTIKSGNPGKGPVIYVMSRDQRVDDNWALIYAQNTAIEYKRPLIVACPIAADYPDAPERQISFMVNGLHQVESRLNSLKIPFIVSNRPAVESLQALVKNLNAGVIICDFNPLRESRSWKRQLAKRINIPTIEVDAHNIVPCWKVSDKQEYAAYTIRPKINKKLDEFLMPIPRVKSHPFTPDKEFIAEGWSSVEAFKDSMGRSKQISLFEPGEAAAKKRLQLFFSKKLSRYNDSRNNPAEPGQSNLSPYLHFGQLSAQRVALEAQRFDNNIASQEAFLEELIIRRELSDNFCYYNDKYDSFDGFPDWSKKTLNEHRPDPRPLTYDRDTLESASTHDELWNAAQTEMVATGKMHGYMRMYWAKKILEWVPSPEEALARAIYLNDKYELDGHDPNGYTGTAWSIGGIHDRPWFEREIFGKVRYMSYDGCRRKFPVGDYIQNVADLKSMAI